MITMTLKELKAEFIRQRTDSALKTWKANTGYRLTDKDVVNIVEQYARGTPVATLASQFGVSRHVIYYRLNRVLSCAEDSQK